MGLHWPQICVLAMFALNVLLNFFTLAITGARKGQAVGSLLGVGLLFTLLCCGGFFDGAR